MGIMLLVLVGGLPAIISVFSVQFGFLALESLAGSASTEISKLLISLLLYIYMNIFEELEKSLNSNIDLDTKSLAKQIFSFFSSEKFIPCLITEIKLKETNPFSSLIYLYEYKEKYLSIKIFFYLLEEIKNEKFDIQIKEIYNKLKTDPNELNKIHASFLEKNINKIKKYFEDFEKNGQNIENTKFIKNLSEFTEENKKFIKNLWILYANVIIFIFPDIFKDILESEMKRMKNKNILFHFFQCLKNSLPDKEQINGIINSLVNINSLNHTKNVHQNFLLFLNIIKNEKEIFLRDKIDNKFFEDFGDTFNINDKLIWTLYEDDFTSNKIYNKKYSKKYNKTILKGKMTEKEKFNFDLLYKVDNTKINENIKGFNETNFKSIFFNNKKITIIRLDLDYFKQKKFNSEQIEKKINIIKKINNLDLYAQIDNLIINLNSSFDLFLKELVDRKIITEVKKEEETEKENDSSINDFMEMCINF